MRNTGLWEMVKSRETSAHVERPKGACWSYLLYEKMSLWTSRWLNQQYIDLEPPAFKSAREEPQLYICHSMCGVIWQQLRWAKAASEPWMLTGRCWVPRGVEKSCRTKMGSQCTQKCLMAKLKCWGNRFLLARERTSVTAMMKFECKD